MPHSLATIPAVVHNDPAATADNATSSAHPSNNKSNTTSLELAHAATKHDKTKSASIALVDGPEGDEQGEEHCDNGGRVGIGHTDVDVTAGVLTSRADSPNSSFSRSETLVDVTAHFAVVKENSGNPNVAERRQKFSKEFGVCDSVGTFKDDTARCKEFVCPSADTAVTPVHGNPKNISSSKKAKTKGRKKSTGDRESKPKLSYHNIYTGADTSGTTVSTTFGTGEGGKAMLGGPSLASNMIGCVVM
ncbi:hypothetical protein MMC13_000706 [Lambiella insularis]|nr:hypothetical protein [Lambiella insularis]